MTWTSERKCVLCSKPLRYGKLYCSYACSGVRACVIKNCAMCGKQFRVPKSHAHRVNHCGKDCGHKSQRKDGVEYNGRWYSLAKDGYYKRPGGGELLHRQLWIDNFGPIPPGFDVHHKNEITTCNELWNFELLAHAEHSSMHNKERHAKRRAALVSK